jgi:predicted NAD/FAD-binding protein
VVDTPDGRVPLDTGFLVHNDRTYPNLVRLFGELGVATRDSDMSFAVSCRRTGLEYSSRGANGFFAQRLNLVKPSHLAYFMAVFQDTIGRRDDAFVELERAVTENSSRLYAIDRDPKMDGLRSDRRFALLRARLFGHASRPKAKR